MVVRFNTDDVTIHLASAGAGKTTTAMTEITAALKSYRPDEIAFVTYTRKGVETGIAKALAVNKDLTPDDLMHFKTLHALCFREAHLARKNIITQSDIAQFNSELGFSLTMNDAFGHVTEDDRLLQRYDAERSGSKRGVFVDGNYDRFRYDRLVNAYKAFKEGHDLVDFYDCLLKYMEQGEPLQGVKIALIDECQDLTPLQWQVCMKAFSEAEKVICFTTFYFVYGREQTERLCHCGHFLKGLKSPSINQVLIEVTLFTRDKLRVHEAVVYISNLVFFHKSLLCFFVTVSYLSVVIVALNLIEVSCRDTKSLTRMVRNYELFKNRSHICNKTVCTEQKIPAARHNSM